MLSKFYNKYIIWGISTIILTLILWNTYLFFQSIKNEERQKMEIWAKAYETINNADPENTDIDFPSSIILKNTTIPIILCNSQNEILSFANIDGDDYPTKEKQLALINDLKETNPPIQISHPIEDQYIYYGNSALITKMKYYPFILIIILILFISLVWSYFKTSKISSENKLWVGMAKETAHQIGTPLSSLLGWIEMMKIGAIDEVMIEEMEKDVHRLNTIADRFSKIGSKTDVVKINIIEETRNTLDYINRRCSDRIALTFESDADIVNLWLNPILHSWTIENLVKNAIDAIEGEGKIKVKIEYKDPVVKIFVKDSGKGIEKSHINKIFEPGFSTKKRGWGLGLSLTKRIVETYHKGKIKVLQSEVGKGTTFLIQYYKN